jgi:hypothetical protein
VRLGPFHYSWFASRDRLSSDSKYRRDDATWSAATHAAALLVSTLSPRPRLYRAAATRASSRDATSCCSAMAKFAAASLEHAQQIAAHESPRTTKLYDRTQDEISLDEVERIRI